jgi:hypothetical protein
MMLYASIFLCLSLVCSAFNSTIGRGLAFACGAAAVGLGGVALAQDAGAVAAPDPATVWALGDGPISAAVVTLGWLVRDGFARAVTMLEKALGIAERALPVAERAVAALERLAGNTPGN